jgi:hypothetical protein
MILKKKKNFILLESLITISLIALASSSLLFSPSKAYKKALESLYKVELSKASFALFFDLEHEFQKKIPFDSLALFNPILIKIDPISLEISPFVKSEFDTFFEITSLEEKENEGSHLYKWLQCRVIFKKPTQILEFCSFEHFLYVCKKP